MNLDLDKMFDLKNPAEGIFGKCRNFMLPHDKGGIAAPSVDDFEEDFASYLFRLEPHNDSGMGGSLAANDSAKLVNG